MKKQRRITEPVGINISREIRDILMKMKLEMRLSNIDEVVRFLLSNQKKENRK